MRGARWGLALALCAAAMATGGCARQMKPTQPAYLKTAAVGQYPTADFNTDVAAYRLAVQNKDASGAKLLRDTIVRRALTDIEIQYQEYALQLSTRTAAANIAGDSTTLGLAAATTLVGGDIKDMLAQASTAFAGARLSVNKNYFHDKGMDALLAQMQASRTTIVTQISLKLGRTVDEYPLDSAWLDLVDLYYAGTLPGAVQALTQQASAAAEQAKQEQTAALGEPVPLVTHDYAVTIRKIRVAYNQYAAALGGAGEAATITKLQKILNAYEGSEPHETTGKELLAHLQKSIMALQYDPGKANKLLQAIQSVGDAQ